MVFASAVADAPTRRVLIVDDNADGAKVLGILLDRCGYAVDVVLDGTQCVSHLESFKPDIVLLDIAMPDVCGYDVARLIRARAESANVILIAISGYCGPQRAQLSLDAGCDLHLEKPVNLATLEAAIADELGRRIIH